MNTPKHYYPLLALFFVWCSCTKNTTPPGGSHPGSGDSVSVTALLVGTKEINYYPAYGGWTEMWYNKCAPNTIQTDFAKLSAEGFTSVRIILQAVKNPYDYPLPSAAELNNLNTLISIAKNNHLGVHLTLFDFWSTYQDISGREQWLSAIVKPLAGNPVIKMIELKNEIDTSASAIQWAATMIPYCRKIDGGIPVTISEYDVNQMRFLVNGLAASPPDFYCYHEYNTNGLVYSDLNQVKAIVGNIPLFIGESGYSTAIQNPSTPQ